MAATVCIIDATIHLQKNHRMTVTFILLILCHTLWHYNSNKDHSVPKDNTVVRIVSKSKSKKRPRKNRVIDTMLHSNSCLLWGLLCALNVVNGENILRVDPLALLSATLRTYQKAACDTDVVTIACPRGTSISIEFAQYNKFIAKDGISIDELCPKNNDASLGLGTSNDVLDISQARAKAKHLLRGSTFGSPNQKVSPNIYPNSYGNNLNPPHLNFDALSTTKANDNTNSQKHANGTTSDGDDNTPESCMWPNALQYSLLQTVVEACQKKKHCKFNAMPQYYGLGASGVGDASGTSSYHSSTMSTSIISADPCPKRRKIVEVAYKCRPYEFRSKVACHNEVAQLECNPYSRIVVYSASFGRTEYESIQCPQPQGVREETCLASYATETVMQICHGRRRCNLAADANTFGSPCQPNSRMYLKVVYTCVPKQVLKDRYESETEADELDEFDGDFNEIYDDVLIYKESEAIPKLYSNTTTTAGRINVTNWNNVSNINNTSNNSIVFESEINSGGVNPVMTHSSDLSLEDDQERLYLYLLIAGSLGVIICVIVVAMRVMLQTRSSFRTESHSTSSVKGGSAGEAGGVQETTIPNGFNDAISEIDADIDFSAPMPLPSVSKNENYITYGPTSSLYGSLEPSNVSHTSSTLLLQGTGSATVATSGIGTASLIANPLTCGSKQSPDILGISSNTYVSPSSAATGRPPPVGGVLTPAIIIGSTANAITSNNSAISNFGNSGTRGTLVPITSLTQCSTAPTFRTSYLINPEAVIQRPSNTMTPPTSITSANCLGSGDITYQVSPEQNVAGVGAGAVAGSHLTATLRHTKAGSLPVSGTPSVMVQQPSYDGTAPRTLSTGVAINSEFYYG